MHHSSHQREHGPEESASSFTKENVSYTYDVMSLSLTYMHVHVYLHDVRVSKYIVHVHCENPYQLILIKSLTHIQS